jgi:hypothetical protein
VPVVLGIECNEGIVGLARTVHEGEDVVLLWNKLASMNADVFALSGK